VKVVSLGTDSTTEAEELGVGRSGKRDDARGRATDFSKQVKDFHSTFFSTLLEFGNVTALAS
jgi:hypothetical protein